MVTDPRHKTMSEAMPAQANPDAATVFSRRGTLYTMHFFFAFVARMWDMGIVLLVAELTNNSLHLVALNGFVSSLSVFLLMSSIGSWMDTVNRMTTVKISLCVKLFSVSLAYAVCAVLCHPSFRPRADTNEIGATETMWYNSLLYSLPLFSAVVKLAFSTITQSVEKDWIVVLSGKDKSWLSTTNSVMSQIDLTCKTFAPAVTGYIFVCFPDRPSDVAVILLVTNIISTVLLYTFLDSLYKSWPALAVREGQMVVPVPGNAEKGLALRGKTDSGSANTECDTEAQAPLIHSNSIDGDNVTNINSSASGIVAKVGENQGEQKKSEQMGYGSISTPISVPGSAILAPPTLNNGIFGTGFLREFASSGCAGAMIAYSFLFLTVLSFGDLMTVYVKWAGLSEEKIGAYRGFSALTGFLGAISFPYVDAKLGIWGAGQVSIVYQAVLVVIAASSFAWAPPLVTVYIIIFNVLLSRWGLWVFDLAARQLAQLNIPESFRGKVNGQWRSMVAFFDMSAFAIAILIPDPADFWMLTTISAAMVVSAAVIYTVTTPYFYKSQ